MADVKGISKINGRLNAINRPRFGSLNDSSPGCLINNAHSTFDNYEAVATRAPIYMDDRLVDISWEIMRSEFDRDIGFSVTLFRK